MINHKLHYKRYCQLMELVALPQRQTDCGYMAALYILAADDDLYHAATPCISKDGINFHTLLSSLRRKGGLETQIYAIKAAHNLFNGGATAVSIEQLAQCPLPALDILVNAIYIQKGQRTPIAGKNGLMDLDCSKEMITRRTYAHIFLE